MKKVLISLSIIGAVAAVVVGATTAYFSDTETSTGNTFTAGSIDLKVDNHCYYNGDECKCDDDGNNCTWQSGPNQGETCSCTWEETDLDGHVFANFSDLKPGDYGEDTISFRVHNNDAWLCAEVNIVEDNDVDCTEPEKESTDPSCQNNTVGDGELDNYLEIFAWVDDGDNVYEDGETPLMSEPVLLSNYVGTFPLADTTFSIAGKDGNDKGLPLTGSQDYYIGKVWCFGDLRIEEPSSDGVYSFKCNGEDVENDAQSDKLVLDVSFTAVQARNNEDFTCVKPQ